MSRICEVCGKNRRLVIMSVTQITKQKQFGTPIFKNYVASTKNGFCEKLKVCTRCIRSGFIQKAV